MTESSLQLLLNRLYTADLPDKADIEYVLSLDRQEDINTLFQFADEVRRRHVGDGILLRGIVEFSNYCDNACQYCGLNRTNSGLPRYTLTGEEIMDCVRQIAACGIHTVVLQSGQRADLDAEWLAAIIRRIQAEWDTAVTLSVGEKTVQEYALWKEAGADRYLLKIETTNPILYDTLHPDTGFQNRLECSRQLKRLGYQNGSGNMVGLPGQALSDIADDILFFARERFDMIGISPFIPHPETVLGDCSVGDVNLALKAVAVTRIVTRDTHMPATTAIGSVNGLDYRPAALQAGANVLMPNFTPAPYRRLYEIYPGKRCIAEAVGTSGLCMDGLAHAIGRTIDGSRGDSPRTKARVCA